MADKIIAIYCFFDDFFKAMGPQTDVHCKVNEAQIVTTALMAALTFYGNHASALDYMRQHHQMVSIDSFPIAGRRNCRIPVCKLLTNKVIEAMMRLRRSIASAARFYGFKVQLLMTVGGLPVNYYVTAGSFRDATALQAMYGTATRLDLLAGTIVYGNSDYTDYEVEDLYAECEQITLAVHRRKNNKRPDDAWQR